LHADEENTEVLQDVKDVVANIVSKRIDFWIPQRASDKVECEIKVCLYTRQYNKVSRGIDKLYQREEGEQQTDKLIHELNMEKNLASDCMVCLPDLLPMEKSIDCSKESTIEPSSAL